jgi:predicted MFS family arabinose efflux permease
MDAAAPPLPLPVIDETSPRYSGWRVVAVCFLTAAFAWALGFYGQTVFTAELQRAHGWPAATVSAATTFFFLFSAVLVAFVGDVIRRLGVRATVTGAVVLMAIATVLFGRVETPWQLYAVYTLMSFGYCGLTVGAISNVLGLWFDKKRGLAISLALNGASVGGVVGVPLLVLAIGALGFQTAMLVAAALMLAVLLPVTFYGLGHPPRRAGGAANTGPGTRADAPSPAQVRGRALRSLSFWTITAPFALVLLSQVGFIVHQISFMEPVIGRERASLAVALMTAMAVTGRVIFGFLIDRVNQRRAAAMLFASQAMALLAMINLQGAFVLFAGSAVFGFSVGNAITLPSIIVHREFDSRDFGVVVSLSTAMSSVLSAFGAAMVGLLRDVSGGYTLPLYVCTGLELAAAIGVLIRRR